MTKPPEDTDLHAETEELQDDAVIGRALVGSAIVLLLVGTIVGGTVFWLRRPEPVQQSEERATVLATTRSASEVGLPDLSFTDITASAGITFVHENGAGRETPNPEKLLPETMGGGGAFLDFDGDGDQDILFLNGHRWAWDSSGAAGPTTAALYANDGRGSFSDVTAGSGFDIPIYAMGCACGDYDNDGRVDVFVSAVGRNHLFHNDGDGRFTDVTAAAGVAGDPEAWGTSCGWFDCDNDGDLDLLVCNYVVWDRETDVKLDFTLDGTRRAYGRPQEFQGTFPYLYRNEGDGSFTDVSAEAGLQITHATTGEPMAKSLGLCLADVNADGLIDVVIANDTVQNMLFLNRGKCDFEEFAAPSGIAFDTAGRARGAMGIDSANFRNSDAIGIAIGNFSNEMTALYVCTTPEDPPQFDDEAVSNGIGPVTRIELTFGILFTDVDLDGRLDLFAANGHLEEEINKVQESQHYEQPPQLLWNCGPQFDDEFVALSADRCGEDFSRPMVGRGASRADIDGDGDEDLLIFASGQPPRLLRNDQQCGHHWLRLKLEGAGPCNRDAIGARVRVELPDGRVLRRTVMPTRSYQSQTELPLTFGLGTCETVDRVTIEWPDGLSVEHSDLAIDQLHVLRRGDR